MDLTRRNFLAGITLAGAGIAAAGLAGVIMLEKNAMFGGSSGFAEGLGALNSYIHRGENQEFDLTEAFLRITPAGENHRTAILPLPGRFPRARGHAHQDGRPGQSLRGHHHARPGTKRRDLHAPVAGLRLC